MGDYALEYFLTSLKSVARDSTSMPAKYINKNGNGVTEAFRNYVRPLVGGLPVAERIHASRTKKIIKK